MLYLGMQKEPYWLDLVSDARVKVKPLEMAIYSASRTRAWADAEKSAGVTRDKDGTLSPENDFALLNSLFNGYFAQHLARYGVVEWSGVSNPDGSAAECTPENAAALMLIPAAGTTFLQAYTNSLTAVVAEGNG